MISGPILHYEILEKLGEGGMGVVYKAEDTRLRRAVALKFLPHDINPTDEQFERFMREAQTAATLNHPNVCVIHAIEDVDDERFIVMEYVDGTTLRVKLQPGPLQIQDAVAYAIQIASALGEAHDRGIVHQDVKSENIMVNSRDHIKVMDFGLARLKGVTHAGEIVSTGGTLAYMSPEQVRGEDVDIPSDIWSFGVVAYEMVTGRLPFFHEYEAATLYSILNSEAIPPSELRPDIPHELEQIILKCLRKDIGARYESTRKIAEDLKALERSLRVIEGAATTPPVRQDKVREGIERKQATVIQGHVTGFEGVTKGLSDEDIPGALDDFDEIIRSTVTEYEGTLHKVSGGSFTAFFGLPNALENAPQKAINAAIRIRTRLHELSAGDTPRMNVGLRACVNTGQVVAGSLGDHHAQGYSVVGEALDVAVRLLEEAGESDIVVGSSTFKYTREEFKYRVLKPAVFSGKRDPVPVYLLLSEREQLRKAEPGRGRTIYSDMVGRDDELDRLGFRLLKTISGQGGIVSVVADAGIGKSRLIAEFRKMDAVTRVALFEGRALSIGKNLGFHPIIDILRNWSGISDDDNDSQAYLKLENSIARIFPDGGSEIFPFIAAMLGLELKGKAADRVRGITGEALNKLIQKSVSDLIIGGSKMTPVVIIIEDFHWADQSSIDLLQSLFRLAENQRILFITTFRPNFRETSDRLLGMVRERYPTFHDEIILKPLDNRDDLRLVENLLKVNDLPPKLTEAIGRAEGNPFFIEEVLRSLIDDGVLIEHDGHFAVTDKVDRTIIPGTIQDVLMSRIDKLDSESRSLLKTASVMGRYFLYDVLKHVEGEPPNLDRKITHLKDLHFVRDSNRNTDRELVFAHALLQELVYNSLVSKVKKDLHLKVANAIESIFSDRLSDFYGMLAFHYSAGGDVKKAEDFLFKAAEQTFNTAASHEAINYLQEAIRLYVQIYGENADASKLFVLERNLGLAYYNKGYWTDSLDHLKKALSQKGVTLDSGKLKTALHFMVNISAVLMDLYFPSVRTRRNPSEEDNSVFDTLYKAASVTANFDSKKMFLELLSLLRLQTKYQLQPEEGHASYAYASGIFSYSGLSFALSRKFMQRANSYAAVGGIVSALQNSEHELMLDFLSGDWDKISDINEEYVEEKLRIGDLYAATLAIGWVIYVKNTQGQLLRSFELIRKQEDIGEAFDFGYARLFSSNFTLDRYLVKRDLREAIKAANRALTFAQQLGFTSWPIGILGKKAKAQVLSGDFDGARESLAKAADVMTRLDRSKLAPMLTVYYLTYNFWYHVDLLEKTLSRIGKESSGNDVKELVKRTHKVGLQALKISRKVADTRVEACLLMGKYFWLVGDQKKAFAYWKRGISDGEQLKAMPDVARIYREVGVRLKDNRSKQNNFGGLSPQQCLEKATQIFRQLGLERDLELVPREHATQGESDDSFQ